MIEDYKETVLGTQKASCTYEFSVCKACTRPTQAQVRLNPTVEKGSEHGIPPPAKELLTTDGATGRGRVGFP